MKYFPHFIAFLKEEECLTQFIVNYSQQNATSIKSHPKYFIFKAFWWDATPERCDFWNKKNFKWLKRLNELERSSRISEQNTQKQPKKVKKSLDIP